MGQRQTKGSSRDRVLMVTYFYQYFRENTGSNLYTQKMSIKPCCNIKNISIINVTIKIPILKSLAHIKWLDNKKYY